MATYTVKLLAKDIVHKETAPNYHEPVIVLPFLVSALAYSDSVELPKEGFTKTEAKALVKDKIIAFLAKKAEEEDYEVTI